MAIQGNPIGPPPGGYTYTNTPNTQYIYTNGANNLQSASDPALVAKINDISVKLDTLTKNVEQERMTRVSLQYKTERDMDELRNTVDDLRDSFSEMAKAMETLVQVTKEMAAAIDSISSEETHPVSQEQLLNTLDPDRNKFPNF